MISSNRKKAFAWSYSALKNFESCPKKYYHLSIAKDIKEVEGEAIQYGKEVHRALEYRVMGNQPLPLDFQYLEPLVLPFATCAGNKVAEQKLAINKDYNPTGWFDPDVWCRAVIDLAIFGEQVATIVDWKTGKPHDDTTQLKLMAAILFQYKPELQKIFAAFIWTKTKTKTIIEVSREEIPDIWADLHQSVKRLEQAVRQTDFPPNPSGLCKRHCPVQTCPHHGEQ